MSHVAVPSFPLYQLGFGPGVMRRSFPHLVRAPKIPLHQLGWLGVDSAKIVGSAVPVVVKGASMLATSAGAGAFAGPIGAAVGVVIGVIAGLLAAHEARIKGATNENQYADSAVPTFDQAVKALVQAFNAGQIDAASAVQQVALIDQNMYSTLKSGVGAPGTSWSAPAKSMSDGSGVNCDKSCTVGCCIYTDDLHPAAVLISQVLLSFIGQGSLPSDPRISVSGKSVTVTVPAVMHSKYSSYTRGSYTLTLTPPSASAVAGAEISNLFSGGSSSLPLILAAVAALAVLR